MNKTYLVIGAGVFMLLAAYLFAPDQAVVMFKELVAAFGSVK
jgi:hypothetical protein